MKLFELYFSDLTPAAQREWVDTFGEKPIEFIPMHSFEVEDDDELIVDEQAAWERFDAACHEELDGGNYDPNANGYDDDYDDDESVDENSMKVDGIEAALEEFLLWF